MTMSSNVLLYRALAVCLIIYTHGALTQVAAEVSVGVNPDPYGHFCPDVDPATQSPIAITSISAILRSPAQPLNMSWTENLLDVDPATNQILLPGPLSVELAETTIQLNVPPNTYFLDHEGRNYSMVQMHLHIPAEHAVDGKRPMLELHIVHQTEAGDLAVVGIMFNFGRYGSGFIDKLMDSIPQPGPGQMYKPGKAEYPDGLSFGAQEWASIEAALAGSFYSYNGSLTTPPCTEGVNWLVMENDWTLQVTRDQVLRMEKIIRDASNNYTSSNARLPYMATQSAQTGDIDSLGRVVYNFVPRGSALAELKHKNAKLEMEAEKLLADYLQEIASHQTVIANATEMVNTTSASDTTSGLAGRSAMIFDNVRKMLKDTNPV